jgi:excisionase family DNA binding protein
MNEKHASAMTIREAAAFHSVGIKTIRRLIQRGELRAYRVGSRLIRLDRESVVNLGHRVGGAK